MKKSSLFFAALALPVMLFAVRPAFGLLQESGKSPTSGRAPVHQIDLGVVQLSPIVVDGMHVPFPIALQMVKKALKRPWSSDRKDSNKLVCRFVDTIATHLQTLECLTNAQYFNRVTQTQAGLQQGESMSYQSVEGKNIGGLEVALERGLIPEDIGNYMNHHPMNRGRIMTILKALPPADSTYTLRVTDRGKPVIEYFIKQGKLVGVRRPGKKATAGTD